MIVIRNLADSHYQIFNLFDSPGSQNFVDNAMHQCYSLINIRNRNEIEVASFISTLPDVQGQRKTVERGRCRKGMIPEIIPLGHGVKSDMTVIAGWSAI